jgi:PAS domain S-box-containing protein
MNSTPYTYTENIPAFQILESITDGFFALDRDWKITYWNKQAETLTGLPYHHVIGNSVWEVFPGSQDLSFFRYYSQALTKQQSLQFREYYRPLDLWLELAVYPSPEGLAIQVKDVGERKKAEEELSMLSLLAKETSNSVTVIDLEGTVLWVNSAFTRVTEYSFDEAIGRRHSDLLYGPDSDPVVIEDMREKFSNKQSFSGEGIVYTKSGQKKWLAVSAQPVTNAQGKIDRFFVMQTDITQQKQMLEELNAQQKKLTTAIIQAQENERAIIGRELHDNVNQILTSVKLYNELCVESEANKEMFLKKSIDLLQQSITEIRNLSQRLSAPSLGNIKLKDSITDLVRTVQDTHQFIIYLRTDAIKGMEVSHDLHLTIYRILQEHLTNVLKHANAARVTIEFRVADNELTMKIIDDGKGFDPHLKQNGIGLSNMKMRAESLQGRFNINSKPGLGCVLIVQFPF